jgi:tetratricopeptide (TPR) repeat protein
MKYHLMTRACFLGCLLAGYLLASSVQPSLESLEAAIRSARLRDETGPKLAGALNDLGTLYHDAGRLRDAERCYKESILLLDLPAESNVQIGVVLSNLAGLRLLQLRYSEAEALYDRVHRLFAFEFGPASPETAIALGGLAQLYLDTGRYREAQKLGERALAALENSSCDERRGVVLSVLAHVAWKQGRQGDAENLLRRALKAWSMSVGVQHQPTLQDS